MRRKTDTELEEEKKNPPTYSTKNVVCPYDFHREKEIDWVIAGDAD